MQNLQIENIKPGDKICTILQDGKPVGVYNVGEFSTLHNKYRLLRDGKPVGLIPVDGNGYYAMHSKDSGPHFYYSANPEHVAMVEKAITEASKTREDKEKQTKDKLKELKKEINTLLSKYNASLDACQTGGDSHGVEIELFLNIGNQSTHIG